MALRMKDRCFDPRRDLLRVVFTFGNPIDLDSLKLSSQNRLIYRDGLIN